MPYRINPFTGELDLVLGPGDGTGATDFATDSGTALPTGAGVITIAGGAGVTTSGAGSTVTVALTGGGAGIDSFSPDSGTDPVIPDGTGLVTMSGSGSITTVGGTNALTTQLTGLTNHAVQIGAGTTTLTQSNIATDGQVFLGATGADPAFATLTSTGSTITFTPGANSLNLETGSAVTTSYTADSGSAVPSSGVLTVVGTNGIATSGSGSTLTIDGTGLVEDTDYKLSFMFGGM